MKEEPTEPNGNEKDIKHRVLSWCGEYKMKVIIFVIITALISVPVGFWYETQQADCSGFNLNLGWDMEGVEPSVATIGDIETEIAPTQEAKFVITVTTPKEGNLKVIIDSPEKTIEVYKGEETIKQVLPCTVRELFVLKGENMEVATIRLKASERPLKYGVTVYATLDNQCNISRNAYFSVSETPTPTTTPPTTSPNGEDTPCYGVVIILVIILVSILLRKKKRKKKK